MARPFPLVQIVESRDLADPARQAIRRLLDAAFDGDFSDDDWRHALGGWHALIESPAGVIAHAAVVPRVLRVGETAFDGGYVEAVAVMPDCQRSGLGTAVMRAVTDRVRAGYEIGALSTGEWPFYARLGWERWRGPTFVRLADGTLRRSPAEDDGVMILRCALRMDVDVTAAIACDERSGDSW